MTDAIPSIQISKGAEELFLIGFAALHKAYSDEAFPDLYELASILFGHVYGKWPIDVPQFQRLISDQSPAPNGPSTPPVTRPRRPRAVRDYAKARLALESFREHFQSLAQQLAAQPNAQGESRTEENP